MEPVAPRRGLARRLLFASAVIVTAPLWVLYVVVALPAILAVALLATGVRMIWLRIAELQMRAELAKAGRLISWEQLERAAAKGGSIIEDAPLLGWNVIRLWWTAETVDYTSADSSEAAIAGDPHHEACVRRYASPASVDTRLLVIAHGRGSCDAWRVRVAALRERHPHVKHVALHSGAIAEQHRRLGSQRH